MVVEKRFLFQLIIQIQIQMLIHQLVLVQLPKKYTRTEIKSHHLLILVQIYPVELEEGST
ncbi:hypothetical protein D3C78_1987890 [compost metagenome]